jgi:hypothetical protein
LTHLSELETTFYAECQGKKRVLNQVRLLPAFFV